MKALDMVRGTTSRALEAGLYGAMSFFALPVIFAALSPIETSAASGDEEPAAETPRFVRGEDGSFTFETGVLKGVLRQAGKSLGLVPVVYTPNGSAITAGQGLFNHYRVFTHGKRYGYGARRWPSTAELHADGSVGVRWPATPDRPFELRATYRWAAPNAVDLLTIVRAETKLEAFEVFLASYFDAAFTDSRVWASRDPRSGLKAVFVSADRELGEWLAFPRDERAAEVIGDGRWALEPHPLEWTLMPDFAQPLAIRHDPHSGITVIVMSQRDDCFGVLTPYGEEEHISNYMSLFGHDIEAGEIASARSRLVVLSDPTEAEILEVADSFLRASP
jgi:hypothetical protein